MVEGSSALRKETAQTGGAGAAGAGRPVLTVGNFDGLHVGHRSILDTVITRARALGGPAAVYTFEPHPRRVLRPESSPRLLTTLEQKLELLEGAGIDLVIVEPFTREFASLPPEGFVREILHERIDPREVYVGYDFRYGRDREGSMRTLTEMGPHLGFSVTIIPEVTVGERDVNSTRIRSLLEEGEVEEAAELLVRPYAIRGRVVEGDHRGRTIGFPTMNLDPENEILPCAGVYAGDLTLLDEGEPEAGSRFPVVTNVGRRPTFKDSDPMLAEAHVIGEGFDAYGRRVEVSFQYRLRAERRFEDVDALRAQIARDVEEARKRLGAA
ncbi:MAG: bifunctional riboflavin kinase/FAD synthetase [Myxococcota bacterium]|nr:bifunctional riboflavin kinase/FAD synthetase [Myxococcota bacterium]